MDNTISGEQLEQIQEALNDLDFFLVDQDDEEVRDADGYVYGAYSGRAMYGKTCLGFVINERTEGFMLRLGIALGKLEQEHDWAAELGETLWDQIRTDQMGRGTIVYFPNLQLEGEEVRHED